VRILETVEASQEARLPRPGRTYDRGDDPGGEPSRDAAEDLPAPTTQMNVLDGDLTRIPAHVRARLATLGREPPERMSTQRRERSDRRTPKS
jgi:hypothetical protein